jgi:competence protein ComEA
MCVSFLRRREWHENSASRALILHVFSGEKTMKLSLGKVAVLCLIGSLLMVAASAFPAQSGQTESAPPAQAAPQASTPTAAAAPVQAPDEWPNSPGKDKFLATCSMCHTPENVLGHNLDSDGWTDILQKMIGYGAQGSDEDFGQILTYLTTNFGPIPAKVNVNTATAMNFRNWLGMRETLAEAIVAYRAQHGDFKSLDDLKSVPGADAKYLDSIKDELTYDPAPAAAKS